VQHPQKEEDFPLAFLSADVTIQFEVLVLLGCDPHCCGFSEALDRFEESTEAIKAACMVAVGLLQ
jgi:hypothetical protein